MSPAGVMATMLPPPAPTLASSVDKALTTRSCSISKLSLVNDAPSITSDTSVDVPPTSQQMRRGSCMASDRRWHAAVPAAGPANRIRYGARSASRQGSSEAVQSAKLSSPVKPSASRPACSSVV
jgi:hypothetical protein